MAKKKTFDNIVSESFEDGYTSEPKIVPGEEGLKPNKNIPAENQERDLSQEAKKKFFVTLDKEGFGEAVKTLSPAEKEILAQKIEAENEEIVARIVGRKDRSTYYLTDLHRACIKIVSYEEDVHKSEVIAAALEKYFSEDVVAAAEELVIANAIEKLKE